jgi:hypothetical protein
VDGSGADHEVHQRGVGAAAKVILDFGLTERKRMNDKSGLQVVNSFSENLKSKIGGAQVITMITQRQKLIGPVGIFVLALAGEIFAAQTDWKSDWERTVAAAKKEGQVTVYIYRYERLLEEFKREFPGINVVAVTGRGNELTNRVMAERRAGKFIADVYSAGTGGNYNVLYKG